VGTFDGSAFVVCPKCGEPWEAEFVACWKCGYQSAAVASDDPVVAAHEGAAGDGDREDGPLAFLTGLLSPGDAAMQAEIAAIHASGRAQIIAWMMLAGLPWLVMLTLGTAFRGLFLLPVVLLLHLIMLVGVASPHFFAIGLAVTASLGAIQALYAAVATFFAILVLIAESRDRGFSIIVMVSATAVGWCEWRIMRKAIALRDELTRPRVTSPPPGRL
jgi:hypothetical protein